MTRRHYLLVLAVSATASFVATFTALAGGIRRAVHLLGDNL